MPVKLEMRNYFLAYLDRRVPSLVLRLLEFCMLVFPAFCRLAFVSEWDTLHQSSTWQRPLPSHKLACNVRSGRNYVLLDSTTDTVPIVQPSAEPGADCDEWHSALLCFTYVWSGTATCMLESVPGM